jgi:hypothetical protein
MSLLPIKSLVKGTFRNITIFVFCLFRKKSGQAFKKPFKSVVFGFSFWCSADNLIPTWVERINVHFSEHTAHSVVNIPLQFDKSCR